VGSLATFKRAVTTEGEPKTTTAEEDGMTNPRGINENRPDGQKGEQETPGKRTEGV
jgi:hypothetical protein